MGRRLDKETKRRGAGERGREPSFEEFSNRKGMVRPERFELPAY
jgi:hypothetical protein